MQILDWVDPFVPWGNDFNQITYMQILKYPEGSHMNFHKDDADSGDTGTVLFNLNHNFIGGNLQVDGHILRPFTGTMVAFNNSTARWHGVDPVLSGERYMLALWFGNEGFDTQESMTEYDTFDENVPTHPKTVLKI